MAVTHNTAFRNAVANLVTTTLNTGSDRPFALLNFRTAGNANAASCPMNAPPFGSASSGVITMSTSTPVQDTNTAGNASAVTKAVFISRDNAAGETMECSVAASGGDITLSPVIIPAGVTLTVTSLTYTAMA